MEGAVTRQTLCLGGRLIKRSGTQSRKPSVAQASLAKFTSFTHYQNKLTFHARKTQYVSLRNRRELPRTSLRCTASSVSDLEQQAEELLPPDPRLPITIITGFLGSGKTTLLNHLLTQDHGKRIAVIVNEFGEIDIDGSLVVSQQATEENVITLDNGCICCSVREDLHSGLLNLLETHEGKYDHIVIETTGLANPGPIVKTIIGTSLEPYVRVEGVVTVVDSKYVGRHLDVKPKDGTVNETLEQIGFADRIIINKVDLVDAGTVEATKSRIKSINGLARTTTATRSVVDVPFVIGTGGFDIARVEDMFEPEPEEEAHGHSHGGAHSHSHGHSHEHTADCAPDCNEGHSHSHGHSHEHTADCPPDCGHDHGHEGHGHSHGAPTMHDDAVTSISIAQDGEVSLERTNDFLGLLLEQYSLEIYRMKGVLAISGFDEKFVFQGVHDWFEGVPLEPWKEGELRTNKIVFIGKDLPEEQIRKGFKTCFVDH